MQERREISSEIHEFEKKLEYIIAQSELLAQKQNNSNNTFQIPGVSSAKVIVYEQIAEFKASLDQAKGEIKDTITKKTEEKIAEKLEDVVLGKAAGSLASTIEGCVDQLDSKISAAHHGIKTLATAMDTQDKGFFEKTMEKTSHFISGQKRQVVQMVTQCKETGSPKTNLQQLSKAIPETTSSAKDFIKNPSNQKFDKALTSANNSAKFFVRYLDDKVQETALLLEESGEKIEKSVEKQGGIFNYSQSLAEKGDQALERESKKLDGLTCIDSLQFFYQNMREKAKTTFCLALEKEGVEEPNPSKQQKQPETKTMERDTKFNI